MAQSVRSIFLSDIHLGTSACQAERLLDFLRGYECERLFLVGDIIDVWSMRRRGIYWPAAQNTVVQKILKRARHDVEVIFVPGNHDEAAREHAGALFGNIRVELDYVHEAADGRRYLLTHGDQFDNAMHHRWVAALGTYAYDLLVDVGAWLSWTRRKLRLPGYWSLAGYAKRKVKGAISFVSRFEEALARHARERGVDGVICGHIHVAALEERDGFTYINCGDWVDSCTGVVEHADGRMQLVRWSDDMEPPLALPLATAKGEASAGQRLVELVS
jgi:UDP-2,3-diacylglucosamine pyrophosphatase LpxH